ncbi:hypothetical protein JOC55_004035 [Paenibacillus sacheonensis]|nr:hypothetical protein [Paenibacillus sacheonensis]
MTINPNCKRHVSPMWRFGKKLLFVHKMIVFVHFGSAEAQCAFVRQKLPHVHNSGLISSLCALKAAVLHNSCPNSTLRASKAAVLHNFGLISSLCALKAAVLHNSGPNSALLAPNAAVVHNFDPNSTFARQKLLIYTIPPPRHGKSPLSPLPLSSFSTNARLIGDCGTQAACPAGQNKEP